MGVVLGGKGVPFVNGYVSVAVAVGKLVTVGSGVIVGVAAVFVTSSVAVVSVITGVSNGVDDSLTAHPTNRIKQIDKKIIFFIFPHGKNFLLPILLAVTNIPRNFLSKNAIINIIKV